MPRSGLVEALRAVKDEPELAALRTACEITTRCTRRLAGAVRRRTERDLAWRMEELFTGRGGEGARFPDGIVGSGPTGSRPHAHAPSASRRRARRHRRGQRRRRLLLGLHADVRDRPAGTRLVHAYSVRHVLEAQHAALAAIRAGNDRRRGGRGCARGDRRGRLRGDVRARARARRRARRARGAAALDRVVGHARQAGNVVTVEPGIYLEGAGAGSRFVIRAIEDLTSSDRVGNGAGDPH